MFLIVIFGQCATYIEKWSKTNGLYWSFITATTVGYGDIRPVKKLSKCCAVIIAILGLIVGGIVVSIALEATSFSIKKHLDPQTREMLKKELG